MRPATENWRYSVLRLVRFKSIAYTLNARRSSPSLVIVFYKGDSAESDGLSISPLSIGVRQKMSSFFYRLPYAEERHGDHSQSVAAEEGDVEHEITLVDTHPVQN